MNSLEFSLPWGKVVNGFLQAGIPPNGIAYLTNSFNEMGRTDAEKVLAGGSSDFGNRSDDYKYYRDLFRALNFLLAISAGKDYAIDVQRKARYTSGSTPKETLAQEVLAEYRRVHAPQQPAILPPTPVENTPQINPQPPRRGVVNQSIREFEAVLKFGNRLVRLKSNVQNAADRFKTAAAGRKTFIADFNQTNLYTDWVQATNKIAQTFSDDRADLIFESAFLLEAVRAAYTNFEGGAKRNFALIKARLDLVTSFFEALKELGPPASLVGKMGTLLMGQIKTDNYDPATKYSPYKGPDRSVITKTMADILEAKERFLTLVDCTGITKQGDLVVVIQQTNAKLLKIMRETTELATREVFGDASDSFIKFTEAQREYLQSTANLSGAKVADHRQAFLKQKIIQYRDAVIDEIANTWKWKPGAIDMIALRERIEMHLYSQYLLALFLDDYLLPIDDPIVVFFHHCGILDPDRDDHEISKTHHRLNWKGGTNHKKVLAIFCRWYLKNINPFLIMVDPAQTDIITQRCKEHIDVINRAISAGRTVSWGWSTWDWNVINAHYAAYTDDKVGDDWEKV